MSEREADPYGAHRFRVTCDALPGELGFTEVRGLSVRVTEGDGGGDRAVDGDGNAAGQAVGRRERKRRRGRPGPRGADRPPEPRETASPTLELSRGVSEDRSLWDWLQSWVAGEADPQDVCVCLLDRQGRPVRGWLCRAATPVRWTGPDLVAERAAVATETLALAHDGIEAITDLAECEP